MINKKTIAISSKIQQISTIEALFREIAAIQPNGMPAVWEVGEIDGRMYQAVLLGVEGLKKFMDLDGLIGDFRGNNGILTWVDMKQVAKILKALEEKFAHLKGMVGLPDKNLSLEVILEARNAIMRSFGVNLSFWVGAHARMFSPWDDVADTFKELIAFWTQGRDRSSFEINFEETFETDSSDTGILSADLLQKIVFLELSVFYWGFFARSSFLPIRHPLSRTENTGVILVSVK